MGANVPISDVSRAKYSRRFRESWLAGNGRARGFRRGMYNARTALGRVDYGVGQRHRCRATLGGTLRLDHDGVRFSEAAAVRWDDIDLNRDTPIVHICRRPKFRSTWAAQRRPFGPLGSALLGAGSGNRKNPA